MTNNWMIIVPTVLLGLPALYYIYRFIFYWYQVFAVDIMEAREFFEANPGRFVVGVYGHTSFLDTPFYLSAGIRMGEMKCLANADYRLMYPWFVRPYVHFIVPGGATTTMDGPGRLVIAVEGTRKHMPHLKRGYYYLAKNTGRAICFCVIDYEQNAVRMSRVCGVDDDIDATLDPLRELIADKQPAHYARYPASVGAVCLP
jgi:hypothetical protein